MYNDFDGFEDSEYKKNENESKVKHWMEFFANNELICQHVSHICCLLVGLCECLINKGK